MTSSSFSPNYLSYTDMYLDFQINFINLNFSIKFFNTLQIFSLLFTNHRFLKSDFLAKNIIIWIIEQLLFHWTHLLFFYYFFDLEVFLFSFCLCLYYNHGQQICQYIFWKFFNLFFNSVLYLIFICFYQDYFLNFLWYSLKY